MTKLIEIQQLDLAEVQDPVKKLLKVPIATIGSWVHPEYGEVKFSQEDFREILGNWSKNIAGYEPPLFLGHPTDTSSVEGAPSVGFLEKLYQEGSVLYGLFDPVDDKVFEDVAKGSYRYSSAELSRNAASKETGEPIGTLLRGAALTNRPFLTGLPRVEAVYQQFSEQEPQSNLTFLFHLNTMSNSIETAAAAQVASVSEQKLAEVAADLTLKLEELSKKLEATEHKLSEANSEIERMTAESALKQLALLNISADTKQVFSELLPSLSKEQRREQLEKLIKLSEGNSEKFNQAQGESKPESSEQPSNPYEDIIKRNKEIFAELNKGKFY
jgi:phage I-like protein